ncbi:plasmid transfer protein TraA [Streptomyces sp. NPDC049879]|uniref:plasmid transfer protein TraA n=1 Tax=Streptomyces sp. NPDC049879 TaxID=3365598 RepID=UPI0037A6066B
MATPPRTTPAARPVVVPPRPETPPRQAPAAPGPELAADRRKRQQAERREQRAADRSERDRLRRERTATHVQRSRSTHRERTKNRSLTININKNSGRPAGTPIGQSAAGQAADQAAPGAEFMTNEDIRSFSEHVRKVARNKAVERSMDAEHLAQVLRHIPTADGSMAGARMRARRVARHLKAIASAEKLIAKQAAALYASFEREFESDLRKVGKARPAKQPRAPFTFN